MRRAGFWPVGRKVVGRRAKPGDDTEGLTAHPRDRINLSDRINLTLSRSKRYAE